MDRASINNLKFDRYSGNEIEEIVHELAQLRISVFHEFPYLYDGSMSYELEYLQTYIRAKNSFVLLVRDQNKVIGATTGIALAEETKEIIAPFVQANLDVNSIFYLGESILLESYRGFGLGHRFFDEREQFARNTKEFKSTYFCSVVRPENHPLKPMNYRSNNDFWLKRGYTPVPDLLCEMSWLDRNEITESKKQLQFWKKELL